MRLPQLAVVDVLDRVPERGVAAALHPVGAEVAVVDEAHLRREPGVDVHAVGDVADGNVLLAHAREERHPHRARDVTVQRRHRVGAMTALEREHGHAELFARVVRVHASEREEGVVGQPERVAQRAEVLFDEVGRKAIVAGRHRRVRREHDLRGHAARGFVDADAFGLHPAANQLERGKRTVPFVEVNDTRRDAERGQRLDAADAEQQFLPDANAVVAAVEPRRQLAILGAVAVDVRVEQQQRVAADRGLPDARADRPGPRLDLDGHRQAVAHRRLHRQQPVIDVDVLLVLPAVAIEPLTEIALVVVEADADERDAEIRRALEMIAGEDAEAAGIDRHRLVQPELGREVRDRPRAEHAGVTRAPGVLGLQVLLQAAIGVVDAAVQRQLRGARSRAARSSICCSMAIGL